MSNTTTSIIRESINDDYEWLQYNKELKIIHSIKDDMYQMNSIISACRSKKRPNDWFKNQSTQELLERFDKEISSAGNHAVAQNKQVIAYEKRDDVPNGLRGIYVHRLLVNSVAMWASPKYALDVFKLLDDIALNERNKLENKLNEATNELNENKPRLVPKKKSNSYKYMIWIEDDDDDNFSILHLVRRNRRTFRQVSKRIKDENCWFFRDELPIAMTPNEDIKDIIRKTYKGKDYKIKGCEVIIRKDCLDELYNLVNKYFNDWQM